jgi:hypothetical protein
MARREACARRVFLLQARPTAPRCDCGATAHAMRIVVVHVTLVRAQVSQVGRATKQSRAVGAEVLTAIESGVRRAARPPPEVCTVSSGGSVSIVFFRATNRTTTPPTYTTT